MSQMRQKETLAFTPTLDLHRRSAASLGKAALVVLTEGAAPIDISGAYLRAVEDHQLADAGDDLDRFLRNAKAPQIITVDVPEANDRTDYVLESAFWLNAQALGFPVQFDLKHLGQDMRTIGISTSFSTTTFSSGRRAGLRSAARTPRRSASEHQSFRFVRVGMMAGAALAILIVMAVVLSATAGG